MNRDLLADLPTTLAEFGLTWTCQSAALLLVGLLAGRLLRRRGPAVQSAVYRTTLSAVLACPLAAPLLTAAGVAGITLRFPTPRPTAEVAPTERPAANDLVVTSLQTPRTFPGASALPVPPDPPGPVEEFPPAATAPPKPNEIAPAPAAVVATPAPPPRVARFAWLPAVVGGGLGLWGLGSAWLLGRMVAAGRRMARLRAGAIPAGPAIEAVCRALAGRLRLRAPAVLRSPFLSSPCVEGLRRPAILLPEGDADADLTATLVHELAHLARRDGLWNLLRRLASALLWFQPLVWMLARRIEVAAEEVCDDHVVQCGADRARYAGLLLDLAGRALPPLSPVGVGMVSLRSLLARRVVRILDSSRALSTRAGTRAVLATLLAGAAATVLAGLVAVGGREPQARAAEAPPQADAAPKTISGRVVDAAGRPVPDATVRAISGRSKYREPGLDGVYENEYRTLARVTTDADGRFSIAAPEPELGPDGKPIEDIAHYITKPGFGLSPYYESFNLPLVPDDVPVTGRLVDLEGHPVVGARVRPTQLFMPWPAARDLEEAPAGWFDPAQSLSYGAEYLATLPPIVTDAAGRFRVDGVGRRRMVDLEITRPDLARKRVRVVTRAMDRVAEPPGGNRALGIAEPGEYGADCTIAVEPTRIIEGVVRDAETGRPIPGTLVTAQRLDRDNLVGTGEVVGRTDAEGRYRLVGLPKCKAPAVAVFPPLDAPYFINDFLEVPVEPGYEPVQFDVPLRRARWITGRVFDRRTNEPVRAAVEYFPMLANPAARDYPNFDAEVTNSTPSNRRYLTDAHGNYRVPGLPGAGVVAARAEEGAYRAGFGASGIAGRINHDQLPTYDRINVKNYQAIQAVDLPAAAETTTADLPLDPGGTLSLRLVDEAGAPVVGADTNGLFPIGASGTHFLAKTSRATVAGLEVGQPRTVLIRHKGRRIGAVVEIPAAGPRDGREQVVVLRPLATVTGRLVGTSAPQAIKVEVEAKRADNVTPPGAMRYGNTIDSTRPDAAGRFRLDLLPAGGTYTLEARDGAPRTNADGRTVPEFPTFAPAAGLIVQPGQVVDLGTFDVTTGTKVEPPVPPAAATGPATETYAGQVVGPDGRAVAGATVRAVLGQLRTVGDDRLAPRRELREAARATTDAAGRYTLRFEPPGAGLDGQPSTTVDVFAQAPGFGVGKWVDGRIGPLVPDNVPITGRLVDPEGNPVAGATVAAGTIYMPRPDHPWPAGAALDRRDSRGIDRLGNQYRDLIAPSTSDADGRFRIVGVGRDRLVELEIRRPGSALRRVHVATRRQDRVAEPPNDRFRPTLLEEPAQYGAECVIVVEPERVIAGQVRDVGTGEPIPDAQVAATQVDANKPISPGDVVARTDAQGRYRLTGLPKVAALSIQVLPPVDRPYFDHPKVDVPIAPGYDPVVCDIPLRAGVWVTGRITNARTGEPVRAKVAYTPYLDNQSAPDYPNFKPGVLSLGLSQRHRTDADGRFRVLALPGRGVVMARADSGDFRVGVGSEAIATGIMDRGPLATYDRFSPNQFHAIAAVDIPPGVGELVRDLTFDPGGATEIRLVDATGRPVAGAYVAFGRYPPGGAGGSQLSDDQATFRATGLEPGQGRTVVVRHEARGIGAVVDLPADRSLDGAGLTLTLRPLATVLGRVVDAGGKPGTGTVTVLTGPGGRVTDMADTYRNYRLATGPLDAEGRFRLATIPSGGTYRVEVRSRPDGAGNAVRPTMVDLAPITPKPGEVLDLGTVDAATGKPVAAAPAAPPARTVTGRVVDAEGRPIAGARVVSIAARRGEPPAGPFRRDPEARAVARGNADAEGRFTLAYAEPEPGAGPPWSVPTSASAPGFGVARSEGGPTTTLPRDDFPVLGRVVDLEGRPIAGASVRVLSLHESAGPVSPGGFSPMVTSTEILLPRPVATDDAGRFRIDGLGRDRLAVVALTGPTVAYREATIATRPGGWIAESRLRRGLRAIGATDDPGEHGAECTIALEPTQVIEGTVRDAATGGPIPGVTVASMQLRREFPSSTPGLIRTQTDAAGRYRLVGLPRNSVSIGVYPPADRPYFANREIPIPAGPGVEPIPLDIPLRAGIWITGRVADARTGAPVAAAVEYFPFLDNPAAAGYANFQPRMPSAGTPARARIDADGRYRVVGLPGRGVVVARTDDPSYLAGFGAEEIGLDPAAPGLPPGRLPTYGWIEVATYQAVRAVAIPPGVGELARDLPVDPGGSLVIRPVDAAGGPLTGVIVRHEQLTQGVGDGPARLSGAPTIRVGGLAANRPHTLVIRQAALDLGAVAELPADFPANGRELAVTLRPTATVVGRVVDAAGEPVGGRASIEIRPAGAPTQAMNVAAASAGRDGRFRVAGIPTGVAATVRFRRLADERQPNGFLSTPIDLPILPQPGATVDLGTLDATTGKPAQP